MKLSLTKHKNNYVNLKKTQNKPNIKIRHLDRHDKLTTKKEITLKEEV